MDNEKKLGFGLMRMPLKDGGDPKSVDIEQTKKMVDLFIERGFTYFDTAWMYHDFTSEKVVKEVLTSRHSRERYTLATKLHAGFFEKAEEMDEIFNVQLEKTGAKYFDYYLLHDMNNVYYEKYTKLGAFEWLQEKKKAGLVKHIGFSFHDQAPLLDKVLSEHPEVEFVQLQINYLDWESPAIQSRLCYETARKYGKDIIVMEPVKGGILAMLPESCEKKLRAVHPDWSNAGWAVRFAAGLPGVIKVLSGMSSLEQLDDNTTYMKGVEPLTDDEVALLKECVSVINSDIKIACTGCSYCTDGCAAQIPIPMYFSLYNAEMKEKSDRGWSNQIEYYGNISSQKPKASACVECGQCEMICPQHLPVIKYLKDVANCFEK